MKHYTVYLGCMIPMRFPSTEKAVRFVFKKLGSELVDLEGYTCCPDPVLTRLSDDEFSLALSARNLALAEKLGNDLLVLCNGCYETLYEARELLEDLARRTQINKILAKDGLEYRGDVKIRAVIDVLHDDLAENFSAPEPRNIKVACHTGCHMLRGGQYPMDRIKILEKLVDKTGAKHVAYGREIDCCSYPGSVASEEMALTTTLAPKLDAMQNAGAEIIVSACPTCVYQFENGQAGLKKYEKEFNIPVFNLLELMALALGHDPETLGLELHRGDTKKLAMEKWGNSNE